MSKQAEEKFILKIKPKLYWIIIVLLVLSNLTSAYFLTVRLKEVDVSKYPYIDISRSFIPQENFVVNLEPLRAKIYQIVKEFGEDSVSIYIEFLNTGANISVNKDNYIWPASLTKVPVAMAVMKKIENGDWQLNNELVLMPGDANRLSGDNKNPLAEYPLGTRFTIEKLLEELLINSDNTAYYILLRNLHEDELNAVILDIGIETLFSKEGQVSAKEYSRIFRTLYTSSFLKRENSQYLLELLDKAVFKNFLSYSIPEQIAFPHKYGQDDENLAYSDSGIVYLPQRPYIITAMFQGDKEQSLEANRAKATEFMNTISEEVYNYFSSKIK